MLIPYKLGFIGMGNMAQSIIKGLIESKAIQPNHLIASNRSPGKLQKAVETWGITAVSTNEDVVDKADVVILSMKPQDLNAAVDPLISAFRENQVVISLAAGFTTQMLRKKLPNTRLVRVIPNTPAVIGKGVIGYLVPTEDNGLESLVEDIFSPLGHVFAVDDDEQMEALMVCCSCGPGFIYEFMMYFQDWVEERGFEPEIARKMVVETFVGGSLLASQNKELSLEDLQNKVASKKGVTVAGLESMRELEIERLLRYSFEKAALRNQELAK